MGKLGKQFKAARQVSTPLIGIQTPDPAQTIREIAGAVCNGNAEDAPGVIQWDVLRGVLPVTKADASAAAIVALTADMTDLPDPNMAFVGSGGAENLLQFMDKLPAGTVVIIHGAHRYLEGATGTGPDPAFVQGVWNVRDAFKATQRTLVLLGPAIVLPSELAQDVYVLDEPYPDESEIRAILDGLYDAAVEQGGVRDPDKTVDMAVDALLGLPAFPAENAAALSMSKTGIDTEAAWERKRQLIEATPGLTVYRGGESIADVGGLANIIAYLQAIANGRGGYNCVVFIDEIEKAMAGSSGTASDSSGVSQDALGQTLEFMQDSGAEGIIAVGPPGAGKSMMAKIAGSILNVPTIKMDMNAAKGQFVGQSEARVRAMFKVVQAISGGRALFIATSNFIAMLPPELKRRFGFGTYFFDLPSDEEREFIQAIYQSKYKGLKGPWPDMPGWTGAEIAKLAKIAWELNIPLTEAATRIVPVCLTDADRIEKLRAEANGKYISASYPGPYTRTAKSAQAEPGREVRVRGGHERLADRCTR